MGGEKKGIRLGETSSVDIRNGPECPLFFADEPVEIPISDVFDLHTFAPRDVTNAVEAYLEEAHRKGFTVLRIIHGRGIGVQRETVRKILERVPWVLDYRDAPAEAGGWGATIVTLRAAGVTLRAARPSDR